MQRSSAGYWSIWRDDCTASRSADLDRGFTGLSAAVQTVLEQDPYGGHVFVFRGAAWRSSEVVVVGWRRALSIS